MIVPWLKENYGCEVVCFCADVGQGDEDLRGLEQKAIKSGASQFILHDMKEEFASEYLFPMLKMGAVYEHKYLLGTSVARPLIAKHLVDVAHEVGADAIAHGATGKGNDQVRFELTVMALDPRLKIIAPWREWDIRSREDAIAYAAKHNVPVTATIKSIYSRDSNLWHLSHEGGLLEDPWNEPEEVMYQMSTSPENAPEQAEYVEIEFESGNPVAVNGEKLSPAKIVETLNAIGGAHGIGRVDLVENRLVGMKSHGVYETPGGTILLYAHRELESLVLDRETMHFKEMVAVKYAELTYNGLWFTPAARSARRLRQLHAGTCHGYCAPQTLQGQHHRRRSQVTVQPLSRRLRHLWSGRCLRPESRRRLHPPLRSQPESPRAERPARFGSRHAEA